jgi:phospholipid/cholesterol/gamma-HCH transport system substrate-binding protein
MRIHPWGVGLFLVIGLGLFTAILFTIGNREKAFTKHLDVYAEFTNISGLMSGSKVRVSGLDAGEIKKIVIPGSPSQKFRLELQIEQKVHALVRADSVVSIDTEGVVGDKFVSIKKGSSGAAEAASGSTLLSKEPLDMAALLERGSGLIDDLHGGVKDLQARADIALDSVTRTVNHTDKLVVGVGPNVNQMLGNGRDVAVKANQLITDVNAGKGTAGMLLKDEATKAQVTAALTHVQQASANLDQASVRANELVTDFQSRGLGARTQVTLDHAQSISANVDTAVTEAVAPDNMGQAGGSNLRDTLSNLNRGTTNIAEDTEALKHNFFFRGFFKKRGFYNLDQVTPAEYLKACDRHKNKGSRKWLSASGLFVVDNEGLEHLSPGGRLQIDSEIAPIVESLPGTILIVEGYSLTGSPDQQFLVGRERADLVRRYLQAHYHVRHSDIGIVPLLGKPPSGSGKESWDGAAIMLLSSKQ